MTGAAVVTVAVAAIAATSSPPFDIAGEMIEWEP
jgi:hypothetical protein